MQTSRFLVVALVCLLAASSVSADCASAPMRRLANAVAMIETQQLPSDKAATPLVPAVVSAALGPGQSACDKLGEPVVEKTGDDFVTAEIVQNRNLKQAPDLNNLGLSEKMSIRQSDLEQGERQLVRSDIAHQVFVAKHENDCKGSICPFAGNKDGPVTATVVGGLSPA